MTPERALVVGFAVTGRAVTRALLARGSEVVVVDDHPSPARRAAAESEVVRLVEAPDGAQLAALVRGADAVLPSPGIPDRHPVFLAASEAGVAVMSEFDLAGQWDDRPLLAVTGTDGKTTVTTMVTEMMNASGVRAIAAGNNELPLVEAIDRVDVDVFVVEASSFRLGHTRHFEPAVATWLNVAEDHLDVHDSHTRYLDAKARIWADLGAGAGVAVANADDPQVMDRINPEARTVTFGSGGDYRLAGGVLVSRSGDPLVAAVELGRSMPHDIANALAASATALEGGAGTEAARSVLRSFRGLSHRVELVGSWRGISWYDDSKATAPHATLSAVSGFDSVVLIAGGRNKGLDLSVLALASARVRAVVAMGESAGQVAAAFAGVRPVSIAGSMAEAVEMAAGAARKGDSVLLSPACASFDSFEGYAERGEAFARLVRERHGSGGREP